MRVADIGLFQVSSLDLGQTRCEGSSVQRIAASVLWPASNPPIAFAVLLAAQRYI